MNVQLTSELPAKYKNLIPIGQASSPPAGAAAAPPPPPASAPASSMRVKALFPFQVVQPGDLALDEGDVVINVKKDSETWWSGELKGARGVFPSNYVEVLPEEKPAPVARPAPVAAPPPPPPAAAAAAATPPPPPASKKPPPPAGAKGKPPPLPAGDDDDEDGPPPPPPPRNPPKFASELTARVPASQGSQTAAKPSAVAPPPAASASSGAPAWKVELERRQAAKAASGAPAPPAAAAPAAAPAAAAAPAPSASPLPPPPAANKPAPVAAPPSGGTTHGFAAPSAAAGGSKFSGTTMEDLRVMLANFAQDRDWDLYHKPRNLIMALTGEVGELAEIFQWKTDAEADVGLPGWSARDRERVEHELSDVLLYLLRIADRCDVDLPAAAVRKIALNGQKYPVEKARGSAKKYNEL